MDRIAFVCQRYGLEVNGGAELLCRQLAERMSEKYDVEIYTTCAIDYITWADEYKPGDECINGVLVHRYPVDRKRNIKVFNLLSSQVLNNPNHTEESEIAWLIAQGPVSNKLIDDLQQQQSHYRAIFFMTYLYYLTAMGITRIENPYLVPTAHDEPPIYLRCYERVFNAAKAIVWNTESERRFAERRFPSIKGKPGILAGVGVEVPQCIEDTTARFGLSGEYIVYVGRIDVSKGCDRLFEYFSEYKKRNGGNMKLALIGKTVMKLPKHPDIIPLGFVTDEEKFSVMKNAKALVLFSQFESLSMVVLESMALGRPVIVNEKCEVLRDHCVSSNAGLYFMSYLEFEGCLNYLLTHDNVYAQMCKNGKEYVSENYQWDIILDRFKRLIDT